MTRRRRVFRWPWRSARGIRADVDDELRFHLDMRIAALIAQGVPPETAPDRALLEFGDVDDTRRYLGAVDRDIEAGQRRSEVMNDLWQDVTYAVRKLRASPAFTVAAVVTLALGIGATTAIYSVVDSVILEPWPFPRPDHLVRVVETQQGHPDAGTPPDLADDRARATKFDGFSTMEAATTNLIRTNGDAERVASAGVSANFFDLLRVKPLAGRFFAEGEDHAGAPDVVVLSEALWRRDFGGDASVVGHTVRIDAASVTVIGIVPAGQGYPQSVELWTPKKFDTQELSDQSRGARWLSMLARVQDTVSVADANGEMVRISKAMEALFPEEFRERRATLTTVQDYRTGDVRQPLFLMLGAAAFVLLIACANVANLMLVRATGREGEMAIRTALGARRGRLARQLVTESVVLSLCGGVVGLGVAAVGMGAMLRHAPQSLSVLADAAIDGRALLLAAAASLLTGLLFGVFPAARVSANSLIGALRAGGRGSRSNLSANHAKQAIVVAEVALAVTLLTGAGLLMHSFAKLLAVDPGFRSQGVLSMKAALPELAYDSTAQRNFVHAVEQRARALPGVTNVGIASGIPLDGSNVVFSFTIRGRPPVRPSDQPVAETRLVSADFFAAMGMPVLRGRGVTAADQPGSPPSVVVSQTFASRFFPGENAVGQVIALGMGRDNKDRAIVGVVGDVHGAALSDAPEPTVYVPIEQVPFPYLTIVARTHLPAASLVTPMRDIVHELDRGIPVYSVQTLEERVASSVDRQRFYALLVGILAAVALVLSAVGLYGVIAYAVSQRSHELGVRVALGATSSSLARMVIGEGLTLTAVGLVIGIIGSLFAERLVASLLFGVTRFDPGTFTVVILVLAGVAALASWLPARRAARADPLVAMRGD